MLVATMATSRSRFKLIVNPAIVCKLLLVLVRENLILGL